MPTSPPAGWYLDPDGIGGQRYWDGERWTKHRRSEPPAARSRVVAGVTRRWGALPTVSKVLLPIVLVLGLVGVGFGVWAKSPSGGWAQLPKRLSCQSQDGSTPPHKLTVSSVEASHPRGSVLQLVVRFAAPLPPSPAGTHAAGFVGYVLTYSVANNGKKFAELGPEQDSSDLAITRTDAANASDARMRSDRDTDARRTTTDTVQILLDLKRFGIDNQPVLPELTLHSQFNTPSTTTVQFATQVCR